MRTKLMLRLSLVVIGLILAVPVFHFSLKARGSGPGVTTVPANPAEDTLALIAAYKNWKLVNPTPKPMVPASAIACAAVFPTPREPNPHTNKFISVYVNQTGETAMWQQDKPKFPVGSVIVKEKLAAYDAKEPELLTVMIKRNSGYYSASGDWEYLVTDGKATSILRQGKLEGCNACHTGYQSSDFVTRTYMQWPRK
jgi:hypothetical protein